ncbi:aromatic acid exporter family protein [Ammoniphilus sp. CFH 90114]|uniref:aromatic acid exporter family protein n=1 Tax=Ammoniphilus sp. CFH 90114 TaxID=2493665 RepID=UPI00100E4CE0|nr:aromatic acid exporter family protein [Ammoniphilus sp. CFH 90114]RXT04531.1 aromatic acid exporter family protein [Ammoniphilus sp. CFH 90114]
MNKWFGKRIIKTAIAVFITAWVCEALGWPVIFAVITAIVTIEPTLSSSIKKGLVRLPAAAIGAAFAMFFDYLFGQTPLTYALSASLTIYICHLLRWNDAMIVATLTAVAMIPMTSDHFLVSFFTRIGTTSIGIIISSMVNFAVMPPNYLKRIGVMYGQLIEQTEALARQIAVDQADKKRLKLQLSALMRELHKTNELIQYQQEGYKYYKAPEEQGKELREYQDKLDRLEARLFELGHVLSSSNRLGLQKVE